MNDEIVNKIKGAVRVAAEGEGESGEKAHKSGPFDVPVSSAGSQAAADGSFQCQVFSGKQQDCLTADNADGTGMGGEGIKKSQAEPNIEHRIGKDEKHLSPALVASQASHESVSPQETCASRNVVSTPEARGEGDGCVAGSGERLENASATGVSDVAAANPADIAALREEKNGPPHVGCYEEKEGDDDGKVRFRSYQRAVFEDHSSGIVVLHWSRQIGKSYVLAAWAVCRLLDRPGRLVTVLSNSRENGAEFLQKCAEICALNGTRFATTVKPPRKASEYTKLDYEDMRMELRIRIGRKVGRIKVLAANPRTARGFSGDLILDEFAFHEDGNAIWEAAEPILASNKDFLCRIASTGNGRHNLFYRMVEGGEDGTRLKAEGKNGETESGKHLSPYPLPTPKARGEGDDCVVGSGERLEDASASGKSGDIGDSKFHVSEQEKKGPSPDVGFYVEEVSGTSFEFRRVYPRGNGKAQSSNDQSHNDECLNPNDERMTKSECRMVASGVGDGSNADCGTQNAESRKKNEAADVAFYLEEYGGGFRKVFVQPRPKREKLILNMTYSEDEGPRYEIVHPPARGRHQVEPVKNDECLNPNDERMTKSECRMAEGNVAGAENTLKDGKSCVAAAGPADGFDVLTAGTTALQPYYKSKAGFWVSRVTRTMAHGMGLEIYDSQTREAITPEQARAQALDKHAYDQNYECSFADENLALLSHELITAAECDDAGEICEQDWSASALERLRQSKGQLFAGLDVGRKVDMSVLTVLERSDGMFWVRAMLRMRDMRLPDQESRLGRICELRQLKQVCIDMTGLGLGLFEYSVRRLGEHRISGINFASSVSATRVIVEEGTKRETVRVTEALAMEVLRAYEDRKLRQPRDWQLREDLRRPGKVTTPGGRVSIAATRDGSGHADHFWSLALALEAAGGARAAVPFAWQSIPRRRGLIC